MNNPSNSSMYNRYAWAYDRFYALKDYEKETNFLYELLSRHSVKLILDVGCGTGTHLTKLAQLHYLCEGIDINNEMVRIAKIKLNGKAFQADMRSFNLRRKYDAVISMYAVFNHNLKKDDALRTLIQCKNHLNDSGLLILDLYNPQSSGQKEKTIDGITKIMKWELNHETQICESIIRFIESNQICEEKFPLRIYSIDQVTLLLKEVGFTHLEFYDNYTWKKGTPSSKNLLVVAKA